MNEMQKKVEEFVFGQIIVGMALLLFGGLVAPFFWGSILKITGNDREGKIAAFIILAPWFIVSWAFLLFCLNCPEY